MFPGSTSKHPFWAVSAMLLLGFWAVGCGTGAQPGEGQPAPQRELLEQQKKAFTEDEFRRLPYGLKWELPQGDVKLPIGSGQPVNVQKILQDENQNAKRGGTLRLALLAPTSPSTEDVFRHTCCSLPWTSVGEPIIQRTAPPEFKLVPTLVESWNLSSDALTYTFQVRKGVKFHAKPPADGRELEARDIVDTLTYAVGWKHRDEAPVKFARGAPLANLSKLEAVDKYTVKMTLSSPNVDFLTGLSDGRLGIFPEGLVEWNGGKDINNFPKTAVATGPFVMVEHDVKARTVWKKHPDYWDKAPDGQSYPYMDEIRLQRVGDAATARAALLAGQLDYLTSQGDQDVDELLKVNPRLKQVQFQGGSRTYNLVNYKNPQYAETPGAWTKTEARWALFLMIDRCKLGQIVQPKSWRYQLFFPYWFPESRSQEELSTMPGLRCGPGEKHLDRQKAVELLKAAGYPKGFKMLDYESQSSGTAGPANWVYGETLHADLNEVMVKEYGLTEWHGAHKPGMTSAETARVETEQLYDIRTQDSYAEVSIGLHLYADWHCKGNRNYEGHCNNFAEYWKDLWGLEGMTFDKMWERQQAELDPAKRMRMIRQMEHYLIWNMAWSPMNGQLWNSVTQPYVKAFAPNWEAEVAPTIKALKWTWIDK